MIDFSKFKTFYELRDSNIIGYGDGDRTPEDERIRLECKKAKVKKLVAP